MGSGPHQQQLSAWQCSSERRGHALVHHVIVHSIYIYDVCVDMVPVLQVKQQVMQNKHRMSLVLLGKDAM